MKFVLDTNAALYFLRGAAADPPPPSGDWAISIITEIELRARPGMTVEESSAIDEFIASAPVIPIGEDVKECAILIRRLYGVKIPDALIAATAQVLDATLVTNDRQLARVHTVRQIAVNLRATPS